MYILAHLKYKIAILVGTAISSSASKRKPVTLQIPGMGGAPGPLRKRGSQWCDPESEEESDSAALLATVFENCEVIPERCYLATFQFGVPVEIEGKSKKGMKYKLLNSIDGSDKWEVLFVQPNGHQSTQTIRQEKIKLLCKSPNGKLKLCEVDRKFRCSKCLLRLTKKENPALCSGINGNPESCFAKEKKGFDVVLARQFDKVYCGGQIAPCLFCLEGHAGSDHNRLVDLCQEATDEKRRKAGATMLSALGLGLGSTSSSTTSSKTNTPLYLDPAPSQCLGGLNFKKFVVGRKNCYRPQLFSHGPSPAARKRRMRRLLASTRCGMAC